MQEPIGLLPLLTYVLVSLPPPADPRSQEELLETSETTQRAVCPPCVDPVVAQR